MIADKLAIRALPIIEGPPPTPVTTGGRIRLPAGEFVQVLNGEVARFVALLEFKVGDGLTRGNHFHERKSEALYVVSGRLEAIFVDVDSGERIERTLAPGDLARVAPRLAHTYRAIEPALAIETSASPFDPADVVPFRFDTGR
jgi:mannose-6-phosphate isomerase-like protein (cupin superfamily)